MKVTFGICLPMMQQAVGLIHFWGKKILTIYDGCDSVCAQFLSRKRRNPTMVFKKSKKKPVTADSGNRIHLLLTYLHSDGCRTPKSKAINDFAQKNSNKHSDQITHFISIMTIIYLTNYSLRYFSKNFHTNIGAFQKT